MLKSLYIENIAVIERASIDFEEGMTVLTGETGAGKSIIIDSINLVLGERTSRELIRTGAKSASVSALFEIGQHSKAAAMLEQEGISWQEGVLFERSVTVEGRSTAKINGKPVLASFLREVGAVLLNIHGQHDSQHLLQSERHVEFLDALAGVQPLLTQYRECYGQAVELKQKLSRMRMDEREKERRIELLSFQVSEIDEAALQPGEEEALAQKRLLMKSAQKVSESLAGALAALSPGEGQGALTLLGQVMHELSAHESLTPQLAALSESAADLYYRAEDLTGELRAAAENLSFDAQEMEQVEQRSDLLHRLKSKYGDTIEEVLDYREKAAGELSSIEILDDTKKKLAQELQNVYNKLQLLAGKLSERRKATAKDIESTVEAELAYLNLDKTVFEISIVPMQPGVFDENGSDEVEFLISTNPGEQPRPLSKIVSGGELSRIMLALKAILGTKDGIETVIFDEIDAGVSGSSAEKIGRKLKELSKGRQVLCITHLAQIACLADKHLLIEKSVQGERTLTTVRQLGTQERVRELARLLSGETVSRAALEHAAQMLLGKE